MIYLDKLPDAVPAGFVLVHNRVRPAARLGDRGFRAWLEDASTVTKPICGCGWAPEFGHHYLSAPGINR